MLEVVSKLRDRSHFLDAVIVDLVDDRTLGGDPESLFELLANLHDAISVRAVCSPHTQLVSFGTNVDNSSTNVLTAIFKGFSNEAEHLKQK